MDRSQRIAAIGATLEMWEEVAATGTFEDAMDALEAIVTLLDEGDLTLDLSVQCFETGTRLSERCQHLLEQAELRVTVLSQTSQYDEETEESSSDPWAEQGDE